MGTVGKNERDKNNYGTPSDIIEKVKEVFDGAIDLDPCSTATHNRRVRAKKFWNKQQDALRQTRIWKGKNIYMNPPYSGVGVIKPFIQRVVMEVKTPKNESKRAIVLTNSAVGTSWWQYIAKQSALICLVKGRINFIDPINGYPSPNNRYEQSIFLLHNHKAVKQALKLELKFQTAFEDVGIIVSTVDMRVGGVQ